MFPLPIEKLELFLICLARVGTVTGTLPIFGSGTIPPQVRIAIALFISLAVFPVVEPRLPRGDLDPVALATLLVGEVLVGLLAGLTARLIFTAVELGGTLVGYQMGFAAANVFDPQGQHQVSLMAQFQNVFAVLIFLAFDIHHLLFATIVRSYDLLLPGRIDVGGEAVPMLMGLAGRMFSLGVQLSAPILAVLLLSGLVLGIMARVFPQLNVFLLSFPLNIGISLVVIGLTLNLGAALLGREFNALAEQILNLFANF